MKTFITLAVAATAAAGALAQSSSTVTVYGLYDAATRHASNANAPRGRLLTMEDGIFTGTWLGFRINESLGGGYSAQALLEAGIDPSTGTSLQGSPTADYGQLGAATRTFGREIHVGLVAPWASIRLGRQYTVAHTLAARFQPQGNPNSTAHSLFSSHHIARQDNLLRLDSKLAGMELTLTRTLGEQAGSEASSAWGLGLGYSGGGFALGAYAQQMKNLAGTETRKILGAGGNVKLHSSVALFGGVMQRSQAVSLQKNRAWTLGANIELGPAVTLSVAYFEDRQSGSTALAGSRKVAWVSASYRLSRRTDVYAVLDQNVVAGGYTRPAFMGTLGTQTGTVLGLRHRF